MRLLLLLIGILLIVYRTGSREMTLQLAVHFPAHTQIYGESKWSALAPLDTFLQRFSPLLMGEATTFSLADGLADILPAGLQPSFEPGIYGERIAIGIADFQLATSTQLLALEIENVTLAQVLLEEALAPQVANGSLQRSIQPAGSIRYEPASALLGMAYELRADVLLIASAAKAISPEDEPNLLANERLFAAYTQLPPADYDAVMLVEGEPLLLRSLGEALVNPALAAAIPPLGRDWPTLIRALGDGALGLRRLDDPYLYEILLALRPLPIDNADFPIIAITAAAEEAVNLALLSQLEAEPALALLGRNLGSDADQLIATVAGWAGWLLQREALSSDLAWLSTADALLPLSVRTLAGLDLEEDLLSWLRGDYLLILAEEPPQFTLISNSDAPEQTAAIFATLRENLAYYDAPSDRFQLPFNLPAAWETEQLSLQLRQEGRLVTLEQPSAAVSPTSDRDAGNTLAALLAQHIPGSQLLLYLDGAHLRDWLRALDPNFPATVSIGRIAFALRWQEGIFLLQALFSET